jgi:protein gp37
VRPLKRELPQVVYGRLLEDAHIVTQYLERGQSNLAYLLEDDNWRKLGFKTINAFAKSLDLSELRQRVDERRQVVAALTGAGASSRAVAEALDVDQSTAVRDAAVMQSASDVGEVELPLNGTAMHVASPGPMLTLLTHTGEEVAYPEPRSQPTFNQTQGDGISWASWSWNPITGCLHGCVYCYAREIATNERTRHAFPVGFTPLFHHERLAAPRFTTIPEKYRDDPAFRRVFVCSMADLYGRWVPQEWIDAVHASMLASPQWEYLLLTKFPDRYVGLDFPPTSWVGTSVDEQKRVKIAERAFRKIEGVKVKWLSLEPLRQPLEFDDLSMFDWVVIGAQTETRQPDGVVTSFAPPFDWVARIYVKAKEAGCKVHIKPNCYRSAPGLQWPDEYPVDA